MRDSDEVDGLLPHHPRPDWWPDGASNAQEAARMLVDRLGGCVWVDNGNVPPEVLAELKARGYKVGSPYKRR